MLNPASRSGCALSAGGGARRRGAVAEARAVPPHVHRRACAHTPARACSEARAVDETADKLDAMMVIVFAYLGRCVQRNLQPLGAPSAPEPSTRDGGAGGCVQGRPRAPRRCCCARFRRACCRPTSRSSRRCGATGPEECSGPSVLGDARSFVTDRFCCTQYLLFYVCAHDATLHSSVAFCQTMVRC